MIELVVDASVIAKWWWTLREEDVERALLLRDRLLRGELVFVVPTLLFLELLNAAARRWRWTPEQVASLALQLGRLRFIVHEPALPAIARWASRGLSAYDASYVALAEQRGATLITTAAQIIAVAPTIARHLRDYT